MPGLGARYAAVLAILPEELLAVAREFFDLVEDEGSWPGLCPEGLLLPKPGADPADPSERRPIRF
eukprot:7978240-Lingulodinium_polyedra.AAC.1